MCRGLMSGECLDDRCGMLTKDVIKIYKIPNHSVPGLTGLNIQEINGSMGQEKLVPDSIGYSL